MSTLAERLQEALNKNPVLSQAGLARACGISTASVSNWFTGETKTIQAKNLRLAAAYLGCARDWLETGLGHPGWTKYQHASEGLNTPTVAQELSPPDLYPALTKTSRVSVIGTLEMSPDKELFLRLGGASALGTVPTLPGGADSFAIQVQGDHLYPTARHGSCLVVEPSAPLVAGEPVLIELRTGRYVVGELVAEHLDAVTVLGLNGAARSTYMRGDIEKLAAITAIVMASKFRPGG